MLGKNRISIIGNLGKDPSLSLTKDDKKVCRFTVAVNERVGRRDTTEWFHIVTFDKLAELCQQYLRKGSLVDIEGRIETRVVTSDSGSDRQLVNVVAREVMFLDKRELSVDCQNSTKPAPSAETVEAAIP